MLGEKSRVWSGGGKVRWILPCEERLMLNGLPNAGVSSLQSGLRWAPGIRVVGG